MRFKVRQQSKIKLGKYVMKLNQLNLVFILYNLSLMRKLFHTDFIQLNILLATGQSKSHY